MCVPGTVAERNVFTRLKGVRTKPITGLVVIVPGGVVEYPLRVLGAARLVHELTGLLFIPPKPPHPAVLPMLMPERRVDVSVGVEGRDELITVSSRPARELFGARDFEADTLEYRRQLFHDNFSLRPIDRRGQSGLADIFQSVTVSRALLPLATRAVRASAWRTMVRFRSRPLFSALWLI